MDKALLLLQIQKQAFEVTSEKELGFHIVNTTKKLVPYRRAIFWRRNSGGLSLCNVSGNSTLDGNSPHGEWLKKNIKSVLKNIESQKTYIPFNTSALSTAEVKVWLGYASPYASLLLFRYGEEQKVIGGVWLERETGFKDGEIQILEELAFYYTRSLVMLKLHSKRDFLPLSDRTRPYRRYIWIVLFLLALFPVRLSISAPTEVIATSSQTLSVPFDGILSKINVDPGDEINENDALASMDIETLSLEANTAREALRAAEDKLSRLRREVLSNPEKKVELSRLRSEIKTKEIEADYTDARLNKAVLRAPRSGVAIFSDKNDLENKPVKTGQAIMQIADPKQIELLIRVPIKNMLPIDNSASVVFYPNATPLKNYNAGIQTIGYQASDDSDGLLTYKIRADLEPGADDIRIGWKGMSKIQGDRTILIYKILRRPIITLRSVLGI